MADRRKSTAAAPSPPLDEGHHALRQVYAAILGPDIAGAVTAVAEIALCWCLNERDDPPEYTPRTQLAAVARDLRRYLEQIARAEKQTELSAEEVAVCRWAGAFAPRVQALAVEARRWVLGALR